MQFKSKKWGILVFYQASDAAIHQPPFSMMCRKSTNKTSVLQNAYAYPSMQPNPVQLYLSHFTQLQPAFSGSARSEESAPEPQPASPKRKKTRTPLRPTAHPRNGISVFRVKFSKGLPPIKDKRQAGNATTPKKVR